MIENDQSSSRRFSWARLIAWIVIGLVVSYPVRPRFVGPGYDRQVFRYMGMLICKGYSPYIDGFDHKPPLIYFFTAAVHALGTDGFWLEESVLAGVAALAIHLVAKKLNWPLAPAFGLLLLILTRSTDYTDGGGYTRGYSTYTVCYALFAAIVMRPGIWQAILIGVLLAFVFMLQQNEIIPAGAAVLGMLATRRNEILRPVRFLMLAFVGAAVPCALVALFFALHHSLQALINDAFVYNFTYIAHRTLTEKVVGLADLMARRGMGIFFIFCFFLHMLARARPGFDGKPLVRLVCWFSMALALWSLALSGRYYIHYMLAVIPYLVMLTGIAMHDLAQVTPSLVGRLFGALLCLILLMGNSGMKQALLGWWRVAKNENLYAESQAPAMKYVAQSRNADGAFYGVSMHDLISLYPDLNVRAPSVWLYQHPWHSPAFDPDGQRMRQEIFRQLDERRCPYVFEGSPTMIMSDDNRRTWLDYLTSHYEMIDTLPTGITVWKRK